MILAPGLSTVESIQLADKLRHKIEEFVFEKPQKITGSFGVANYKKGDLSTHLINRADEALYRAKENGRNQVQHSE